VELVAPERSPVGPFESLEDSRCPIKRRHILPEMPLARYLRARVRAPGAGGVLYLIWRLDGVDFGLHLRLHRSSPYGYGSR